MVVGKTVGKRTEVPIPIADQKDRGFWERHWVSWACGRDCGLCLNHTVQKDSREVLGTSFGFGPTSEILENIQYGEN